MTIDPSVLGFVMIFGLVNVIAMALVAMQAIVAYTRRTEQKYELEKTGIQQLRQFADTSLAYLKAPTVEQAGTTAQQQRVTEEQMVQFALDAAQAREPADPVHELNSIMGLPGKDPLDELGAGDVVIKNADGTVRILEPMI